MMEQIDAWIPVFDKLCPMHVLIDDSGHILHAGPTLQKLRPDEPLAGQRFLELFELRRPRAVCLSPRWSQLGPNPLFHHLPPA